MRFHAAGQGKNVGIFTWGSKISGRNNIKEGRIDSKMLMYPFLR
jgi:hypothetical protein